MKRRILRVLAAVTAGCILTVPTEAAKDYKPGDVSRNGIIDDFDVTLMRIGLLKGSLTDAIPQVCFDLNEDNVMNAADFSLLKQIILKPAQASPQPQPKKLIWSDEFSGSNLNDANWSYELGNWKLDAYGNYITNGWGNNEQQFYTDRNASVHDGILTIAARKEQYTDPVQGNYSYTSARLSTQHKFSTCGGRIEVRARCDSGKSLWPAIWMLPEENLYGEWAASGELDVMEGWGSKPEKVCGSIHFGDTWPNNCCLSEDYYFPDGETSASWHTYAVEWQRGEIRWYVDDNLYSTQMDFFSAHREYPAPFDQNFYLILNLAVGGAFDGIDGVQADPSVFADGEKHFDIDYVRVYDLADGFSATRLSSMLLDTYLYSSDATLTDYSDRTVFNITDTGSVPYGVMGLIRAQSVKKGETYTLSFGASASVNRDMTVTVEDSSYKRYIDKTISIGSAAQHYVYTFTSPEDMLVDIKFQLGDISKASKLGQHTVTISHIQWK